MCADLRLFRRGSALDDPEKLRLGAVILALLPIKTGCYGDFRPFSERLCGALFQYIGREIKAPRPR